MVELSFGERASDGLARFMGTWRFVILQAALLTVWFAWNVLAPDSLRFDPYPFILANLFMSAEAAFTAPVLLMSANRSADADRTTLQSDVKMDEESLAILKYLKEKADAAGNAS